MKFFLRQASTFFILFMLGCRPGSSPSSDYTLVTRQTEKSPIMTRTVTLVRRFEKKSYCEDQQKKFSKLGFVSECRYRDKQYDAMFRGEALGNWYVLQRLGGFSPEVIVFEFDPPLPDEVMIRGLRRDAPHGVKFAALHHVPAEVRIFSPSGRIVSSGSEA